MSGRFSALSLEQQKKGDFWNWFNKKNFSIDCFAVSGLYSPINIVSLHISFEQKFYILDDLCGCPKKQVTILLSFYLPYLKLKETKNAV